ncbi:hypothetical protein [Maridesulfovibrio bastinii]|uniref:hypothetical protein n=1 Tax=Maridesulfovibrio bastinii TaxID=47157 RepID=UPI0004260D1A|nr:hypothetical protein [Maridesulfovibrio bastinii]
MNANGLIFPLPDIDISDSDEISCSGFCIECGKTHTFRQGKAQNVARHLLACIEKKGSIDLLAEDNGNPLFSLDYLYSKARGQMFGVMTVVDSEGREGFIQAFSGQYNSIWSVPGWVPPILNETEFNELTVNIEKEIKDLGKKIALLDKGDPILKELKEKRKKISADLMSAIHRLFRLNNFKKKSLPLPEAALPGKGIPTGTGECCAPKLLNYAALNGLHPTGIAEIYIGKENRSCSRKHGVIYPSCTEKCSLILGFMLCGLQ